MIAASGETFPAQSQWLFHGVVADLRLPRLSPHESPSTDVILLGHSMGGMLAAEIVLLPAFYPDRPNGLRHRILGTINFDTPFLGMHPGIVISGIGSLFRPAGGPPTNLEEPLLQTATASYSSLAASGTTTSDSGASSVQASSMPSLTPTASGSNSIDGTVSPLLSPTPSDPNYNPPFSNDVRIPIRSGWDNALHFVMKHSNDLTHATKQYVTSHLEFGGCLADYSGLKSRYNRLRALEDAEELDGVEDVRRVRFVNYYTASTGRPRNAKPPPAGDPPSKSIDSVDGTRLSADHSTTSLTPTTPSPRISVEQFIDDVRPENDGNEERLQDIKLTTSKAQHYPDELSHVGPQAEIDNIVDTENIPPAEEQLDPDEVLGSLFLPPIANLPTEPAAWDGSSIVDKDARKVAEKEHARTIKAYKQAVKDHEKALKDRQKLAEKREKRARQEREKAVKAEMKQAKADEKERLRQQKHDMESQASENRAFLGSQEPESRGGKKPRDRKFCMLPPKINGERDPTWVRVYMVGVDEVGAHCGLFAVGDQYEQLVGDVGCRIETWIRQSGP